MSNVWSFYLKGPRGGSELLTLAATDTQVVQYNSTITISTGGSISVSVLFLDDFAVKKPNPRWLMPPDRCYGPGFVCPNGNVSSIDMIRFHTAVRARCCSISERAFGICRELTGFVASRITGASRTRTRPICWVMQPSSAVR